MVSISKLDSTRLETFSDAVFAFSATLLVVSLEVPESFPQLIEELRGFVGFGIRFGVLLLLWSVHHSYFRRYKLADSTTIFLNSCLLFVILFYVYPMKFMSEAIVAPFIGTTIAHGITSYSDLALVFVLYSAGFVAIFFFVVLMYLQAYRQRQILNLSPIQEKEALFYARHYGILTIVAIVSVIMAIFEIGISIGAPGYIYVILGPLCYLHGRQHQNETSTLD